MAHRRDDEDNDMGHGEMRGKGEERGERHVTRMS